MYHFCKSIQKMRLFLGSNGNRPKRNIHHDYVWMGCACFNTDFHVASGIHFLQSFTICVCLFSIITVKLFVSSAALTFVLMHWPMICKSVGLKREEISHIQRNFRRLAPCIAMRIRPLSRLIFVFSIHPRDKQDVADRLVLSGLSVGYSIDVGKYKGAFPSRYFVDRKGKTFLITYDYDSAEIDVRSTQGFDVSYV